ncbi:hydrogenase 3 maturation endopeptidase HyCI, partial [Thermococcus sp. GR7]|nr:hydrogenase 3 maturation endopeptidase HyCI [Thermococcus sp. GR7]
EGTLGEAVSTHGLPLKFVTQYMKTFIKADFVLIGCQPGSTGLFEEPSELIRERAGRLAELLAKILEG